MGLQLYDFPEKEYNIADFGATVCDSLQTDAIQATIDACFLAGGGRVVIPAGIYLTGGLRLRSNVALYLQSGAILKGSTDPADYMGFLSDRLEPLKPYENNHPGVYPYSRWNNGLIRVIDAKNVAIIGEKGSYIDGSNCYDPEGEEKYRGPHGINIQHSENILLDGYTVVHSANWAHAIFVTKNITARNLTVLGGHDGFDVRTCDDILVENCEFYSGDDCIAGFDNCDVVIRNCILNCACSSMRFGGNNVLVENCRSYTPARFGFRGSLSKEQRAARAQTDENCRHSTHTPFKYYCDFRAQIRKTPGDILIRNCTFEGPDSAFLLEFDGAHKWCCNRSLASVTFENCVITGVSKPLKLHGDAAEPIDFRLKNVRITAREGFEDVAFMEAANFSRIVLENVQIEGYRTPTIHAHTEGMVELTDTTELIVEKS